MRPAGEVRLALIQAAQDIVREIGQPGRGPTLKEIYTRAQVGSDCARNLVPKIKKAGDLRIVGTRRVDYRNRPVSEYAPAAAVQESDDIQQGWVDLGNCMADWVR